jgi:hypothetical protein
MKWRLVRRRKRRSSVTKHYLAHKESARSLVVSKLTYWNKYYGFTFNRVSIKNTRRSWGSCSALKNLNFSYKLLFIPEHLQDYVIVHELCHLQELNHSTRFWILVEKCIPKYKECIAELKHVESKVTPQAVLVD